LFAGLWTTALSVCKSLFAELRTDFASSGSVPLEPRRRETGVIQEALIAHNWSKGVAIST